MTKLIALAANQTALDDKTKGNATKAAKVQAKAAEAKTMLDTMQANATLVSACSDIATAKAAKAAKSNSELYPGSCIDFLDAEG